jgi:phosphatidylinositol alpha-1,6-mannosyltransferase
LPLLVEAYAEIVKDYPGRLALVLVGEGPEKARLQEMCEGLEGVVFVGAVESAAHVAELMRAVDCFVYPIVYSGGIAMAVLEAMACELPVIVGPAGPSKDVLVDGKMGFVMHGAEAAEIVRCVTHLSKHPRVGRGMGRSARESVSQKFGVEQFRQAVVDGILWFG